MAVLQALDEYEQNEEERAFLKAIAKGMIDVNEGKELSLSEVTKKLGIE